MWLNKYGSRGWFTFLLSALFSSLNASHESWWELFVFVFFLSKVLHHLHHAWSSKNKATSPLMLLSWPVTTKAHAVSYACAHWFDVGILRTLLCSDLKGEAVRTHWSVSQLWKAQRWLSKRKECTLWSSLYLARVCVFSMKIQPSSFRNCQCELVNQP